MIQCFGAIEAFIDCRTDHVEIIELLPRFVQAYESFTLEPIPRIIFEYEKTVRSTQQPNSRVIMIIPGLSGSRFSFELDLIM